MALSAGLGLETPLQVPVGHWEQHSLQPPHKLAALKQPLSISKPKARLPQPLPVPRAQQQYQGHQCRLQGLQCSL